MVEGIKAGAWDVAFLAIDPLRANVMDFTAPYGEIEGACSLPGGSRIRDIADVDRDGVRVAVVAKSNYDLFLTRNLQHAELVRIPTTHGSADVFAAGKVDVLAGVRQRVDEASRKYPGSRLLEGRFMVIRQAVAVPKGHAAGLQYVREFVEDIKESGLVAREFQKAGVPDAAVARQPAFAEPHNAQALLFASSSAISCRIFAMSSALACAMTLSIPVAGIAPG